MATPRVRPLPPIEEAMAFPNGARFFRCALQVNPYAYLQDRGETNNLPSETAYNEALVAAAKNNGVEVVAITDHHRVRSAEHLLAAFRSAGIVAFPGFEAQTTEGVHILCLFSPETDLASIERYLGDCGLHHSTPEEVCKYTVIDLLEKVITWGGLAIAPHVTAQKGLLSTLSGQARARVWRSESLVAVGIPGTVADVQANYKNFFLNKEASYQRVRPVTPLNCNDVSAPENFAQPSCTTLIKMTEVSIEGLRQAFLDPESRILLNAQAKGEDHSELVAMSWEGGFLDGMRVHFNQDLNVFIGGRGTGKSTIIESIRYTLGICALAKEAQENHERIVRSVLGSGTKITLRARVHRPAPRMITIERTVPNAPIVRDEGGALIDLAPLRAIGGIEILGQHEITEVTRNPRSLTELLSRFAAEDYDLQRERLEISRALDDSRTTLIRARRDVNEVAERLASLPALEETLRQYERAGLQERLRDQTLLVREERVFRTFDERLTRLDEVVRAVHDAAPVDPRFLRDDALADLPSAAQLRMLKRPIQRLDLAIHDAEKVLRDAISAARRDRDEIVGKWTHRRDRVQQAYEKILRDLHKERIDGEEFIRLKRRVEDLRPLAGELAKVNQALSVVRARRATLLLEWDEVQRRDFRRLQDAAETASRRLGNRLRIMVDYLGDREPLLAMLQDAGFRKPETPRVKDGSTFSLRDFAVAVSSGVDVIGERYIYSQSQIERLAAQTEDWKLRLEELALPATTRIELNVGVAGRDDWRALNDLSTGQKATAVLLLLLIDSEAPLVVDQPEDDLDNRFISDSVVGRIREAKGHRQFVFATHNANIPVLGDAELIAGMTAVGDAASASGRSVLSRDNVGSIDKPDVARFVEDILEGGKAAFLMRREKYGF